MFTNKILGTTVTNFFSILGAIATLLSTYIVCYAYFTDSGDLSSTGVSRIQEAAANMLAPEGFVVKPAKLLKVPDNTDFQSGINIPILITNKEIPFMIYRGQSDYVYMKINGSQFGMGLGDIQRIRNSNCQIWLYAIEEQVFSFKMDCYK